MDFLTSAAANFMPTRGTMMRLGVGGLLALGAFQVLGRVSAVAYTPDMFEPAKHEDVGHIMEDALIAEMVMVLKANAHYNVQLYTDIVAQLNMFLGTVYDGMRPTTTSTRLSHQRVRHISLSTRYLLNAVRGMSRFVKSIPQYDVKGRKEVDDVCVDLESACKDLLENLRLHLN